MLAQRLDELDRASTGYPGQLNKLLYDEQWKESLKLLPEGELTELISHLDNVRLILTPAKFHLPP